MREWVKDLIMALLIFAVAAAIAVPFLPARRAVDAQLPAVKTVSGNGIAVTPEGVLIDVNSANVELLESLPGVGPVLAQRIIDHRNEHGPFGTVDDLLEVSGVGSATLEAIRPEITAAH